MKGHLSHYLKSWLANGSAYKVIENECKMDLKVSEF